MADPYAPPQAPPPPRPRPTGQERGGCLTALLILMMVANPLTGLLYIGATDFIKKGIPNAPEWAIPALTVLCFGMFACAIAMFRWKKWGLYGALGIAATALVVNIIAGINPVQAIMSAAAAPSFLIVLIKPRWHLFT